MTEEAQGMRDDLSEIKKDIKSIFAEIELWRLSQTVKIERLETIHPNNSHDKAMEPLCDKWRLTWTVGGTIMLFVIGVLVKILLGA